MQHNKPDDLWIIIDSYVYDLTDFLDSHPGGEAVLLMEDIAGQDATETFLYVCTFPRLTLSQRFAFD